MSWELIHRRLLHPSNCVMEEICRQETLYGLLKTFPKKINTGPCKTRYTEKMTTIKKVTKV